MGLLDLLAAFGRAVLKIFISAVIGVGVGLVTMGYFWMQRPSSWDLHGEPPVGDVFLGVGAGLLSAAAMMLAQFYGPWAYQHHLATVTQYPDRPSLHDAS